MNGHEVNLCSLEHDEGVRRVRVWGWYHDIRDPLTRRLVFGHAASLPGCCAAVGRTVGPLWIDRFDARAVEDDQRALDYLTFAEQRAKDARVQRFERATGATVIVPRALPIHVEQFPPPPIGVHVAGPVVEDVQRCARCHAVIAVAALDETARPLCVVGWTYPVGTLVERGRGWQAITFVADAPTCEEMPI